MRGIFTLFFLLCHSISWSAGIFSPENIAILKKNMLANITVDGAIMASPQKENPNYYYDWVRDSAIAMDLIASWYEQTNTADDRQRLLNYVSWSERLQYQDDPLPGQDILGEPKFYMPGDAEAGRPYSGSWGRPQNDGPALRALTLIHFANLLLAEGERDYVSQHLYNGRLQTGGMGLIKNDLEYVAHHWQEKNFDLWEEVFGHHFFTTMVQRKALLEGAKLATVLHDDGAALFYQQQAAAMATRLLQHIDQQNNIIQETLPPHTGPQKPMELDSAILLGVLIGDSHDNFFSPDNEYVGNTLAALKTQFKAYAINAPLSQALLFGRYPDDTYDGQRNDGLGNPWFILTASVAEYNFKLALNAYNKGKSAEEVSAYVHEGDAYLRLIKDFAPTLELSEQINRNNGSQQGARSLTWSYVAVLRALEMRDKLNKLYNLH